MCIDASPAERRQQDQQPHRKGCGRIEPKRHGRHVGAARAQGQPCRQPAIKGPAYQEPNGMAGYDPVQNKPGGKAIGMAGKTRRIVANQSHQQQQDATLSSIRPQKALTSPQRIACHPLLLVGGTVPRSVKRSVISPEWIETVKLTVP